MSIDGAYNLSTPEVPNIDEVTANASALNHDPFKYSHGLTGIDQPANYLFVNILIVTALIPALITLLFRIFTGLRNDRRRVAATNPYTYYDSWKIDGSAWWGTLKRYFIYAPLHHSHHNRELQIPKAFNARSMLTRPQFLIIAIYVLSNLYYCIALPGRSEPELLAAIRGRCGALATFNLILTILFALRNNPFIWILHASYDTFNLFHRWAARLVILEAAGHVLAFACNAYQVTYDGQKGWNSIFWILSHSLSYRWGLAAFIAFAFLLLHSVGPLRHAFYETFLSLHRLGVIVAISGLHFHLVKHALPQLPWVYLVITLLVLESTIRLLRIIYLNFSRKTWTTVTIEALPQDATRVTLHLPRSWNPKPGAHIHVYLPRVSLLSSHPFSVAWMKNSLSPNTPAEKLPLTTADLKRASGRSTVSCIVRARTGMTRKLYDLASATRNDQVTLYGAVEGPYGGYYSLQSYGTVILFAGGVGITHQVSFVRQLLVERADDTAAVRKILLVWSVPSSEAIEWVRPWLDEVAAMEGFASVVRIRLYVSKREIRDRGEDELPSYLDVRPKRCEAQEVVDEEIITQVGAMVVSVCGPGGLNDSVRAAVRRRVCIHNIDFIEEAFSY